jgi:dTMP kinase
MESQPRAFFEKVRQGYLQQAKAEPERIVIVDAGRSPEAIHASLLTLIETRRHAL